MITTSMSLTHYQEKCAAMQPSNTYMPAKNRYRPYRKREKKGINVYERSKQHRTPEK